MLLVWKLPVTRPTRDIDLLGRVSNDLSSVRQVIAERTVATTDYPTIRRRGKGGIGRREPSFKRWRGKGGI